MVNAHRDAYAGLLKDLQAKKFSTGKDALDAIQKLEQSVMIKVKSEQTPGK